MAILRTALFATLALDDARADLLGGQLAALLSVPLAIAHQRPARHVIAAVADRPPAHAKGPRAAPVEGPEA